MNPTHGLLTVENLSFGYPHCRLFAGWSACIGPGVTLVRGGDGAGKSTLLRLLAGVLPPQHGELALHGAPLAGNPEAWRQQVFWVDMRADGCNELTARECLVQMAQRHPGFQEERLGDLVQGLSLAEHMEKRLFMLSTGTRRKVWLAAAFASGAAVSLIDEPFAALDRPSIGFVTALLQEASCHPARAWVVADYAPPSGVKLAATLDLGGTQRTDE